MKTKHYTPKHQRFVASFTLLLCFFCCLSTGAGQTAPNLGSSATYGAFTGAGAIENTGLTVITGDIGTHAGSFTGFPPGIYTGTKNVANAASLSAKNDLTLAYNSLNDAAHAIMYDTVLGATMGNGQVLTPRTYRRGDLTTLSGDLTFDAVGNPEAVFVIKIGAALNVSANTRILLANGARASNIYWAIDGAVSVLDNSVFKGSILSNGAIHLYGGSTLEGRALAVIGAVTFASNLVSVPGAVVPPNNSLIVITPATGDTVQSAHQAYQITWAGIGIADVKTFEYSLDSGRTWTMIGGTSSSSYSYSWNVPDTTSNTAQVRITDANNMRGLSGLFTIARRIPATFVVVRPAFGEVLAGGTLSYAISWTATSITRQKTFALSLDSGATWTTIGTTTSDSTSYAWNVPDTNTTRAFIRITDQAGQVATSGMFSITKSSPVVGSIVVHHPVAGEIVRAGYENFLITYTATNTALFKTFAYSLDSGATWVDFGTSNSGDQYFYWARVPDTATTSAYIRITDGNGVVGISGQFTIRVDTNMGSIDAIILTGLDETGNIANSSTLGIEWIYTPEIGDSVTIEYSIDYTASWSPVTIVRTSDSSRTSWMTLPTGYYNPVFIRVSGANGIYRVSAPFSIGTSTTSVEADASAYGFDISNYPNPTTDATTIAVQFPTPTHASVTLFDMHGNLVYVVAQQQFSDGWHYLPVNTATLSSGVYTYVLDAGAIRIAGRMHVLR